MHIYASEKRYYRTKRVGAVETKKVEKRKKTLKSVISNFQRPMWVSGAQLERMLVYLYYYTPNNYYIEKARGTCLNDWNR